jgi:hypothetical protein
MTGIMSPDLVMFFCTCVGVVAGVFGIIWILESMKNK